MDSYPGLGGTGIEREREGNSLGIEAPGTARGQEKTRREPVIRIPVLGAQRQPGDTGGHEGTGCLAEPGDSGDPVGSSAGRLPGDCCHPEVPEDSPKAGLPLGTQGRVTYLCYRSWRVAGSGMGSCLSPVQAGCAMPSHVAPFPVCHSLCATPCHSLCPIPCRAGRSGIAPGACLDISAPRCQFYTRPRVTPGWPRPCPRSLVLYPRPLSLSLPQSLVPVSQRWHPGPTTLAPAASFLLPPPSVSRSPRCHRSRPVPPSRAGHGAAATARTGAGRAAAGAPRAPGPTPPNPARPRDRRELSGQSRCSV